MSKWDRPEYQRIARAEHRGDEVVVTFEDGSRVTLRTQQLVPKHFPGANWSDLEHNTFELIVPTSAGSHEIPWSTIRALSDKDFGAHLAQAAEEEAKQIGLRLKELREAKGISSKELAARASITPQSLSRIENGRHDVTFTTLRRILAAMGSTLKELPTTAQSVGTLQGLMRLLKPLGFTKQFITRRLIPRDLARNLNAAGEESVVQATARAISDIYGWSVASILEGRRLSFDLGPMEQALFKGLSPNKDIRTTAYTLYVHWLAVQTVQATPRPRHIKLSDNPLEIRKEIIDRYGDLTLKTLLSYAWDSGFVVLPLSDEGIFHGACWKIDDRVAIVVKQRTRHQARWLFDLAHELAHAILHLTDKRTTVLELEEISHFPEDKEEIEASDFAQDLIFKGKVEDFAEACVRNAKGNLRMLKIAVEQVAKENRVPVDALANYMAYRLSMQNENWWGAANNMQSDEPSPLAIARDELNDRVQLEKLNPEERRILLQAFEAQE